MTYLNSPAMVDIMDILEVSSNNGYNFVAPEILN